MRNPIEVARHARIAPARATRPLIAVVFEGLSEERKQLPSVLLYDEEGARLYERLCEQPEYPLVRAEAALLESHASAIARAVGPQAAVVEYGAGDGRQGERLVDALGAAHSYVAVDVEASRLAEARARFRARGLAVRFHALCQDFRQYVALPALIGSARRRVAFVPGGTVGAFRPLEAVALLNAMREAMGAGGGLLAGIDLLKAPAVHERAANDAAGVASAFNRNLLCRLNREVDATFDLDLFRYQAAWNEEHARVETSLFSTRTQCPSIAGIGVALGAGEEIVTALSHKYALEEFEALAGIAGWALRERWVDPEHLYALAYLETAEG